MARNVCRLEEMIKVGKDACLDIAESMDSVIRSMV